MKIADTHSSRLKRSDTAPRQPALSDWSDSRGFGIKLLLRAGSLKHNSSVPGGTLHLFSAALPTLKRGAILRRPAGLKSCMRDSAVFAGASAPCAPSPAGRRKIAHRFIGGMRAEKRPVPPGTEETFIPEAVFTACPSFQHDRTNRPLHLSYLGHLPLLAFRLWLRRAGFSANPKTDRQ